MQLSRRLASAIAGFSFLIASSVLAIISFREGFSTVILREGLLKSIGTKWKREDAGALFLSFPWKWHSSAEDTQGNAKADSNTVVTITVCAPAETLPTVPVSPPNAIPTVPLNSNSSPTVGTSDASSLLGASACNISPSVLSACSLLPTSAGYVCQYYPPTVYPTDCSGCVKTSTVTDTYLSTVSNCHTAQFSFIAEANVTLTANLSTSAAVSTVSTTLAIKSSNSAPASQEFSLLPTGNLSLSALLCPHGALTKRQKGCVPSLAISALIHSSAASPAPTLFGSVPNSTRSVLVSQTLFRSFSNSSNLVNNTTDIVSSIATGIQSHVTTGGNSNTAIFSTGGHSVPNVTSNVLTGTNSIPGRVSTSSGSTTSVENLPSNLTSNRNTIQSLTLLSVVPVASSIPADVLSSANSALPVVTGAAGIISSTLDNVKSLASTILPAITPVQSLISSSIKSVAAIADSGLPIVSSLPTAIETVLAPAQSSVSTIASDLTAATTPVLSVPVTINGGEDVFASIVEPITSAALSRVVDITNVIPAVLSGRLVEEAANPSMPAISMATSMTRSAMGDTPGVVTVTRIIRVVSVSVYYPLPTSSM